MAKEDVERLLGDGGDDKTVRARYDGIKTGSVEEFIALAKEDGYNFTEEELMQVLNESGDVFERNGNPPKFSFWWT